MYGQAPPGPAVGYLAVLGSNVSFGGVPVPLELLSSEALLALCSAEPRIWKVGSETAGLNANP